MIFRQQILIGTLSLFPAFLSGKAMAQIDDWECVIESSFRCANNTCEQVEFTGTSYVFLEDETMGLCDQNLCWLKAGRIFDSGEYYTIIMETWWAGEIPGFEFETNAIENGGDVILAKMSLDGSEYLELWVGKAEVLTSQGSCHELEPAQPEE